MEKEEIDDILNRAENVIYEEVLKCGDLVNAKHLFMSIEKKEDILNHFSNIEESEFVNENYDIIFEKVYNDLASKSKEEFNRIKEKRAREIFKKELQTSFRTKVKIGLIFVYLLLFVFMIILGKMYDAWMFLLDFTIIVSFVLAVFKKKSINFSNAWGFIVIMTLITKVIYSIYVHLAVV